MQNKNYFLHSANSSSSLSEIPSSSHLLLTKLISNLLRTDREHGLENFTVNSNNSHEPSWVNGSEDAYLLAQQFYNESLPRVNKLWSIIPQPNDPSRLILRADSVFYHYIRFERLLSNNLHLVDCSYMTTPQHGVAGSLLPLVLNQIYNGGCYVGEKSVWFIDGKKPTYVYVSRENLLLEQNLLIIC